MFLKRITGQEAWEGKMTTASGALLCSDDEEVGRYLEVRSYLNEGTKRVSL